MSIYAYIEDGDESLKGICKCGTKFEDTLVDESLIKTIMTSNKEEIDTICPRCDRDITVKKIDLILNLRCLKRIKNKLERRCISLILDDATYKILDVLIGSLKNDIKIEVEEESYNIFKLDIEGFIYKVSIQSIDMFREFNKCTAKYNIDGENGFDLKLQETFYY